MRNRVPKRRRKEYRGSFGKIMKCLCSGEQLRAADEMEAGSNSLAINDYGSEYFSRADEVAKKLDAGNIEEAELSLRESGCLNYEVRVSFPLLFHRLLKLFLLSQCCFQLVNQLIYPSISELLEWSLQNIDGEKLYDLYLAAFALIFYWWECRIGRYCIMFVHLLGILKMICYYELTGVIASCLSKAEALIFL